MSMRHSEKLTLTVIVHTISTVKKVAKDEQSGILMSFGIKKQKSTLTAYSIPNIYPHKKNNV